MPDVVGPPRELAQVVNLWAPGIYREFWESLITGVQTPVQVTSYWRSPAENNRVRGLRDSQHLIGLGIDLVFRNRGERNRTEEALRSLGLVAVPERDHLHVQAWPAGIARQSGLLSQLRL